LSCLPAIKQDKRPAFPWREYQSRLPTEAEFASWSWADAVCLVCGPVSGGLEMIDFDKWSAGGEQAFNEWKAIVDGVSPGLFDRLVVESSPSGGRHVAYRCEGEVCGNKVLAKVDGQTLIETRGTGGQFLCAPSPGYTLLQGDLAEPPTITASERNALIHAAMSLGDAVEPEEERGEPVSNAYELKPGADFNQRGDVRDLLHSHGWRLTRAGENEHWTRPGKDHGTSATLKGGVFYPFSSNAEPFEAHKPYSPFAVYATLVHRGNYSEAAKSLARKGYGSSKPAATGVDLSGFGVGAEDDDLLPMPVDELVKKYPAMRQPVIHGILRRGETMNVIASPKAGKSWMVLDLAMSIANGTPWLGSFPTEQGKVLLIDNELHKETLSHRVAMVAEARGLSVAALGKNLDALALRGQLKSLRGLENFFAQVEHDRYQVIILDAFYRFMGEDDDENSNGNMTRLYDQIDRHAKETGACFVMIHHASKGSQASKSVTDIGAGAGAQSRAADSHLVLRPHQEPGVSTLEAKTRSWLGPSPMCLRWEFPLWHAEEGLDPTQLEGVDDRPKGQGRKVYAVEDLLACIGMVANSRTKVIESAIKAGLPKSRAEHLLKVAIEDGLVEEIETDNRGKVATMYRLPKPVPTSTKEAVSWATDDE
jgi:hypothetical protein